LTIIFNILYIINCQLILLIHKLKNAVPILEQASRAAKMQVCTATNEERQDRIVDWKWALS